MIVAIELASSARWVIDRAEYDASATTMLGQSTEDASYNKAMYKSCCGILAIDLSIHWTPSAGYFASDPAARLGFPLGFRQ